MKFYRGIAQILLQLPLYYSPSQAFTMGTGESMIAEKIKDFEGGFARTYQTCLPAGLWYGKIEIDR
jgi:hypothetical protein